MFSLAKDSSWVLSMHCRAYRRLLKRPDLTVWLEGRTWHFPFEQKVLSGIFLSYYFYCTVRPTQEVAFMWFCLLNYVPDTHVGRCFPWLACFFGRLRVSKRIHCLRGFREDQVRGL